MKIGFLLRDSAGARYFVNKVHGESPVSFVIQESHGSYQARTRRKLRENTLADALHLGTHRLVSQLHRRRPATGAIPEEGRLSSGIEVIPVDHINSQRAVNYLTEIKPDLLLVCGTSIVHAEVLGTAPLALNVHAGLSPYYRGTHCSEWALINWDPYNIGPTLHVVSARIDGGAIVAQCRTVIRPDDTVASIERRMRCDGTRLTIEAVRILAQNKRLKTTKQDLGTGYLTLQRQWNRRCLALIRYIEANGVIAQMLAKPARKALPIIEGPVAAAQGG